MFLLNSFFFAVPDDGGGGDEPTGPIVFVGAKIVGFSSNVDQVVSLGDLKDEDGLNAAISEHDLIGVAYMIATQVTQYDQSILVPAGFEPAHTPEVRGEDSFDVELQLSYKFMGPTPDATLTLKAPGNASHDMLAHIFALRGVDANDPCVAVVTSGANTPNPNPAAITPGSPGSWISVHGAGSGSGVTQYAAPADLSALTNHFLAKQQGVSAPDGTLGGGFKTDWVAGSFDPAAWTGGGGSTTSAWAAITTEWKSLPVL